MRIKIIIDIGARFTKSIVLNEGGDIIAVSLQTTEGIEDGLIVQPNKILQNLNPKEKLEEESATHPQRVLESVFESIRKAKHEIGLPIVNLDHEKDEIYVTTTLKHCYIVNTCEPISKEKKNGDISKICTWSNSFKLGHMETQTPIPKMESSTLHQQTFVAMDPASQNALKQMFKYNNSELHGIFFGNCMPITSNATIRVDVGYSGTRVYSNNNIMILEKGLEQMYTLISRKCQIPLRDVERLVQIQDDYNPHQFSETITTETRRFIKDLFTEIIEKSKIYVKESSVIEVSGGILHIPFVLDFIQSQFNMNVMEVHCNDDLSQHNVQTTDFANCLYVKHTLVSSME